MKKVLLTGAAVFASLITFSQAFVNPNVGCDGCVDKKPAAGLLEGFHPEMGYAKDFFTKTQAVQNVYWWTQPKPANVIVDTLDGATCKQFTRQFTYSYVRQVGKQSYVINQPYGLYEPVGVGFGSTYRNNNQDSSKVTMDLSGGKAFLYLALKNTSTVAVQVRLGLQDSSGHTINSVGISDVGVGYNDEVTIKLAPGASMDTTIDFNTNAYKPMYSYTDCKVGTDSAHDVRFDYKLVAGATITLRQEDNAEGDDAYKPFPLNGSFEITKLFIGDVNAPVGLFDNYIAKPTFKISPNPVNSGSVKFEKAENVTVTDLMGKLVYSAPSASEINVEGFNKGVYIITTSKGAARFVVE